MVNEPLCEIRAAGDTDDAVIKLAKPRTRDTIIICKNDKGNAVKTSGSACEIFGVLHDCLYSN